MHFDLSDEQTAALLRELNRIIDGDRYRFSPRIRTLKEIRAKIKLYPAQAGAAAPPPTKYYEPPSKGRYKRRR